MLIHFVSDTGYWTFRGDGWRLGMAMGRGEDGFYLPLPHTLFSHTYPLPYPYPTGMRN